MTEEKTVLGRKGYIAASVAAAGLRGYLTLQRIAAEEAAKAPSKPSKSPPVPGSMEEVMKNMGMEMPSMREVMNEIIGKTDEPKACASKRVDPGLVVLLSMFDSAKQIIKVHMGEPTDTSDSQQDPQPSEPTQQSEPKQQQSEPKQQQSEPTQQQSEPKQKPQQHAASAFTGAGAATVAAEVQAEYLRQLKVYAANLRMAATLHPELLDQAIAATEMAEKFGHAAAAPRSSAAPAPAPAPPSPAAPPPQAPPPQAPSAETNGVGKGAFNELLIRALQELQKQTEFYEADIDRRMAAVEARFMNVARRMSELEAQFTNVKRQVAALEARITGSSAETPPAATPVSEPEPSPMAAQAPVADAPVVEAPVIETPVVEPQSVQPSKTTQGTVGKQADPSTFNKALAMLGKLSGSKREAYKLELERIAALEKALAIAEANIVEQEAKLDQENAAKQAPEEKHVDQ